MPISHGRATPGHQGRRCARAAAYVRVFGAASSVDDADRRQYGSGGGGSSSQLSTRFVTCQPSRRAIGSSGPGCRSSQRARRQAGTGPGAGSPHYEPGSAPPAHQLEPLNFHCRLTAVVLFSPLSHLLTRFPSLFESTRQTTFSFFFFRFRFEGRMTPTPLMISSL